MEEARKEVAAADQAVAEARQTAVHDTSLFANAEVLVEALKIPPQAHGLDLRTGDALTRMTEAQHKMKARQQQQAQIPGQPLTPTVTQGAEPFKELPVTQEADLMHAFRQAESSASGQDQERDQRKSKKMKIPTAEELQGGVQNDLGEQWAGMDEGLMNRFIQAVNERYCSSLIKKKQSNDENRQAEVPCGIRRRRPKNKKRSCPICDAQSQLQTLGSKSSMCETTVVVVWKCSKCSQTGYASNEFCCAKIVWVVTR